MPDHAPTAPRTGPIFALPAVAAALLLAACATAPPPPAVPSTAPAPYPSAVPSSAGGGEVMLIESVDVRPALINARVVRWALDRSFPARLRDTGRGGTVETSLVVSVDGVPSEISVTRGSGYPEMDAAAIKVAELMRFSPGLVRGRPVVTRVEMPITFVAEAGGSPRRQE
ncbi:MAG TPA: energy transducer TonB [Longimicrobium sp.]|nr:energy transducer TonB [Longimicrobium sp.]